MSAKTLEQVALAVGAVGGLVIAWAAAALVLAARSYQGPTEAHHRREKWANLVGGLFIAAGFAGVLAAVLTR